MVRQWLLKTHGDPLGTLFSFISTVWEQNNLDGMLVSQDSLEEANAQTHILDDSAQLNSINPFKPLMTLNSARLVPKLVNERPNERFGAILRPCEMRALIEMVKHDSFSLEHLLTISIDCLGTFPVDDLQWRAMRKGSTEKLAQEALQFARQGGIVAYRYRSACQMCSLPNAQGAQLNIGFLGLPVRQNILVSAGDEAIENRLNLQTITDGEADETIISQHERMLAKLDERRVRTREHVIQGLGEVIPSNVEVLIEQFENCGACQECLKACPICSVDFPRSTESGKYVREDVMRWLVSCAGCGMCENACPNHRPLSAIFSSIKQQLEVLTA